MKKVISLALFGDSTRKDGSGVNYHAYLQSYVLAHANLFPADEGWELHVHVDNITFESRYGVMLKAMEAAKLVTLKFMGTAILTHAMLWRLAPVFEWGVDFVMARDIDCIPMPRDRAVCDAFIASGCAVGSAHDSLGHVGIMGGLCAFNVPEFRNATKLYTLNDLYDQAATSKDAWALHGTDQVVLNRLIDRPNGPTLLEHRYNGWHAGPGKFPARKAGEYRTRAFSTPTPDKGKSRLSPELREKADRLANHLGAAGYDIDQAMSFWTEHGDPAITRAVMEASK